MFLLDGAEFILAAHRVRQGKQLQAENPHYRYGQRDDPLRIGLLQENLVHDLHLISM